VGKKKGTVFARSFIFSEFTGRKKSPLTSTKRRKLTRGGELSNNLKHPAKSRLPWQGLLRTRHVRKERGPQKPPRKSPALCGKKLLMGLVIRDRLSGRSSRRKQSQHVLKNSVSGAEKERARTWSKERERERTERRKCLRREKKFAVRVKRQGKPIRHLRPRVCQAKGESSRHSLQRTQNGDDPRGKEQEEEAPPPKTTERHHFISKPVGISRGKKGKLAKNAVFFSQGDSK